jgi:orotidine-5'-phosphate decarboxylase
MERSLTGSFAERAEVAKSRCGPLVFGIDPSGGVLERWGLGDTSVGLGRFVDKVVETASGQVAFVKPQVAFFERHGWQGFRELQRFVSEARSAGLLVILDAKRGDIGTTNDAYADAYLRQGSPLSADAVTVHPYLGLEALSSLIEAAWINGACVFVVTRSSNPEGRPLQTARLATGMTVEAELLAEIGRVNAEYAPSGIGPVGSVVGISATVEPLDVERARAMLLAPGLGAQGGTPADLARAFGGCRERVLPSASRAVLERGPDVSALRAALQELSDALAAALDEKG